jgi:6-phosphogluconolactonase
MTTDVVVHADADLLAQAAAARLIVKLIDAQAARGEAALVLTGGRIAAATYRAIAGNPARDAVEWSKVDVWWSDERFLPSGHPDRNETQARAAFLDALPLERAAAPGSAELPHFDVLLLGIGEDGHVASVFPEHPVTYETRPVSAVRGSPKPPPACMGWNGQCGCWIEPRLPRCP